MANPNNLTGIGHPGDPAWQLPDIDEIREYISQQLTPRFANTTEDIELLVDTVGRLTMRSEANRETHEKGNVGSLGFLAPETKRYEELAPNPGRIGEMVYWLGHMAHAALNRPKDLVLRNGIGLELGGNLQFGNWETTGPLDSMAREIPPQLDRLDKDISMKIYGERRDEGAYDKLAIAIEYDDNALKNYVLEAIHLAKTPNGNPFTYGSLRRRRAVADIYIPGLRPIEIYKDAEMVIIPRQMERDERISLYAAYKAVEADKVCKDRSQDQDDFTPGHKNTPDAKIAGNAVERAITSAKGSTKDVIPIGARYVMKMFRDGRGMAASLQA